MKIQHTLIAFALLLALGGVFYYLSRQPASPSPDAVPKEKLFSFTPDQVEEFTIEVAGEPSATFRRRNAGEQQQPSGDAQWEITSPAGIAADPEQVQLFLEDVPMLEAAPLDAASAPSLADYGLDPPEKVFRFKLQQGEPVSFSLGKQNPSGFAKYGLVSTAPTVYLLDSYDTKALEKTLFDLRDKRILPADLNQAERLELQFDLSAPKSSPEELAKARELGLPIRRARIGMTRLPNGNWQLSDPEVRTDFNSTNYLVTSVGGAQMNAIEQEQAQSLAPFGLDRPSIRLNVATPGGDFSLSVGKKKESPDGTAGYYAKNSLWPHIFTINQMAYDQLNQDFEYYRNRFLFDFQTFNARRLEIQGPLGEMRFDKKGEDWLKANDASQKADAAKLQEFLDHIHSVRIERYIQDQPGRLAGYGLNQPWLTIRVTYGEDNQTETLLFARQDNRFFVARQGEPSVYELSPAEPENLESKLKELSS